MKKKRILWVGAGAFVLFVLWSHNNKLWSQQQLQTLGQIRNAVQKLQRKVVPPPGTVVAFAGHKDNVPEGWLLCNGRSLSKTSHGGKYEPLFKVLRYIYGRDANNENIFHIPDYRGRFLRGVAYSTGKGDEQARQRDPDLATRKKHRPTAIVPTKDSKIGSVQPDAFKDHTHSFRHPLFYDFAHRYPGNLVKTGGAGGAKLTHTAANTPRGGPETRPKNVYVHYIIKY